MDRCDLRIRLRRQERIEVASDLASRHVGEIAVTSEICLSKTNWKYSPSAVPDRLSDACILAASGDGDEGMPDGVLIFQTVPFVEQHGGRIKHPADDERPDSVRRHLSTMTF
jgi:hypothetical protein